MTVPRLTKEPGASILVIDRRLNNSSGAFRILSPYTGSLNAHLSKDAWASYWKRYKSLMKPLKRWILAASHSLHVMAESYEISRQLTLQMDSAGNSFSFMMTAAGLVSSRKAVHTKDVAADGSTFHTISLFTTCICHQQRTVNQLSETLYLAPSQCPNKKWNTGASSLDPTSTPTCTDRCWEDIPWFF